MRGYLLFVAKRFVQLLAVIFVGVSVTFLVTHLSPINPVEQVLGRMTARSQSSARSHRGDARGADRDVRRSTRPLLEQFVNFWERLVSWATSARR